MNQIPKVQNEARQLDRLAAQRQVYSTAKWVLGIHALIGGPVAVMWALAASVRPEVRGIAALWGAVLSLADLVWLSPWQKRLRERAAVIQDAFDVDVLALPWNDIKVGKRPDPEHVREYAAKYQARPLHASPLTDWYPPIVGTVPLPIGRIICQRLNCWWDASQRQRYATTVLVILVSVVFLVGAIGFVTGMTVEKLVLGVLVPLSPALLLGIRQYHEQSETATRLVKLKEHADRLWADAISGADTEQRARVLQDEIFENRKRSPLVFDWIYRRLRPLNQAHVDYSAEHLVEEFRRGRLD